MLDPLTTFQVIDTRDPDELAAGLSRLFGRVWLDLHGRNAKLHARVRYLTLGDVGIIHGQYDTGLKAHFPTSTRSREALPRSKAPARTRSAEGS